MSYQKHKSHYMHYVHIIKPFLQKAEKQASPFSTRYLLAPAYMYEHIVHRTYIESLSVRLQTQKTNFLYHENEFMSKHKIYFFIYEYVHNSVHFCSQFYCCSKIQ